MLPFICRLEGINKYYGDVGYYQSQGCNTTLMALPLLVKPIPSLILSSGRVCVMNFSVGNVGEIANWKARLD